MALSSRLIRNILILTPLVTIAGTAPNLGEMGSKKNNDGLKNVIVLIPDGCGTEHMTFARWFKGDKLAQDNMDAGLVRTYSANSLITGSAAASTAFACGFKTWEQDGGVKCLGMLPDSVVFPLSPANPITGKLPDSLQWRPVASVLEGARLVGKSTGLIATSRISHATPAGFSSHWHDRDNDNVIIEQQVYGNINVVFGGGMRHLLPSTVQNGKRKDNDNLRDVLVNRGYKVITTKTEIAALPSNTNKVWGMFNSSHMSADINRKYTGPEEPSLAEMTKKAIDILSQNKKGFFLMVEGSQVDWASHNNDPAGVVTEYIAFDSAVSIALEYAKKHSDTEVLVFPDHNNGGMSIGNHSTDISYTDLKLDQVIKPIKNVKITSIGLLDSLIRYYKENSAIDSSVVAQHLFSLMGIEKITVNDTANINRIVTSVKEAKTSDPDVANIGAILSRRCAVGWTTYGHTAGDIPFFSLRKKTHEILDNTNIAEYISDCLGVDLNKVNTRLVNDASVLFSDIKGVSVTLDSVDAANGNGTVTIQKNDRVFVFPFYKNIMIEPSKSDTTELEGLTLYSQKTNKAYLPFQAKKAIGNQR
jgi:alkaline phosphatase